MKLEDYNYNQGDRIAVDMDKLHPEFTKDLDKAFRFALHRARSTRRKQYLRKHGGWWIVLCARSDNG